MSLAELLQSMQMFGQAAQGLGQSVALNKVAKEAQQLQSQFDQERDLLQKGAQYGQDVEKPLKDLADREATAFAQLQQTAAPRLAATGLDAARISAAISPFAPSPGARLQIEGQKEMQESRLEAQAREGQLDRESRERIAGMRTQRGTDITKVDKLKALERIEKKWNQPEIRKQREAIKAIDTIDTLLKSNNAQALPVLQRMTLTLAGEERFTDQDVKAFGGVQNLRNLLDQWRKKITESPDATLKEIMTEADYNNYVNLINTLKERELKTYEQTRKQFVNSQAKLYGAIDVGPDEINNLIGESPLQREFAQKGQQMADIARKALANKDTKEFGQKLVERLKAQGYDLQELGLDAQPNKTAGSYVDVMGQTQPPIPLRGN